MNDKLLLYVFPNRNHYLLVDVKGNLSESGYEAVVMQIFGSVFDFFGMSIFVNSENDLLL